MDYTETNKFIKCLSSYDKLFADWLCTVLAIMDDNEHSALEHALAEYRTDSQELIDIDRVNPDDWKNAALTVVKYHPRLKKVTYFPPRIPRLIIFFDANGKLDIMYAADRHEFADILSNLKYISPVTPVTDEMYVRYEFPGELSVRENIKKIRNAIPLGSTYVDLFTAYNAYIRKGKNLAVFHKDYPIIWNLMTNGRFWNMDSEIRETLFAKLESLGLHEYPEKFKEEQRLLNMGQSKGRRDYPCYDI